MADYFYRGLPARRSTDDQGNPAHLVQHPATQGSWDRVQTDDQGREFIDFRGQRILLTQSAEESRLPGVSQPSPTLATAAVLPGSMALTGSPQRNVTLTGSAGPGDLLVLGLLGFAAWKLFF